jgi:hypothetical protein
VADRCRTAPHHPPRQLHGSEHDIHIYDYRLLYDVGGYLVVDNDTGSHILDGDDRRAALVQLRDAINLELSDDDRSRAAHPSGNLADVVAALAFRVRTLELRLAAGDRE